MRFSDIRDHDLPLGRLSAWMASDATLAHAAVRTADPRGPSHNQHGHISHALTRRVDPDLFDFLLEPTGEPHKAAPTGWLGVSFEVPSVSGHCLRRAFEAWMCRHETLRSGFRPHGAGVVDAEIERFTLEPDEVRLDEIDLGAFTDAAALTATLDDFFNRCTDAVTWPTFAFAAISSAKSTTVILAFDHVNVDGYSILLAAGEIRELVDADREGRPSRLPPVPSYLDFVQTELAVASEAPESHEAVDTWREFLGDSGTLPGFPLSDGLPPGSQIPQEARCIPILTDAQGAAFGAWCRANGVSAASGFLAAMSLAFTRAGSETVNAQASSEGTGSDVVGFRSLVSTHTRHEAHWAEALGWFTAIAPFAVEFGADRELIDVLPLAADAWTTGKRGAGLPMSRISDLLDVSLQPRFVVSYLDARYVRSASRWETWNAHAILGDVGPTDEVYVWINRMPTETYLTWRFPSNEVCRAQIEAVTESMRQIILDSLSLGTEPVHSSEEINAQW
ncbi:MAG: condensation domain-containing protein [Aquihabitans sp.]